MKWWLFAAIPLLVNTILSLIESGKQTTKNTVRASRGIRALGWICGVLAVVSAVICLALHAESKFLAAAMGFAVLSFLFLVINLSLRIDYSKDGFTVRKFFGKPKSYRYEQIDGVILGSGGSYKLIINGKRLLVDSVREGNLDFLIYARERYSRKCSSELPMLQDALFHGFIYNPGEFLLVLLIIPVLVTALGLFIVINETTFHHVPNELQTMDFAVQDFREINNSSLELQISAGTASVPIRAIQDRDALEKAILSGETFRASVVERNVSKDGRRDYSVWRLSDLDGNVYATENSVATAYKRDYPSICAIVALVTAAFWVLFAGCIYVMNHAPEHPLLMRILVKKEYWNF